MKNSTVFDLQPHDARDPSPWLALYLDESIPIGEAAKRAWLVDSSSWSRQFLLPFVRPFARLTIILFQVIKAIVPERFTSSKVLHRVLVWGLKNFVRPEANWLILRHFHLGSEILDFIARNVPNVRVPTSPLRPRKLEDLKDDYFLKHDLNLFNFVINLGRELKRQNLSLASPALVDYSGLNENQFGIESMPDTWHNVIDLQTAIELFTPVYQIFLTDNDFWRASNSLQLDETIGIYVARILQTPYHLSLVNNKHPMVPQSTLRAGFRLSLHGLATEMLYEFLLRAKAEQCACDASIDRSTPFAPHSEEN